MREFKPYPYQELMINWIIENLRCGLWVFMGGGKSASTLMALLHLSLVEDVFPALVLAPLRVARSTWPEESKKWEQLKDLRIVPITGDAQERRAAMEQQADVYTCNYENIGWLITELKGEWPYKTIVCDESTKLKGHRLRQGGQRTQALSDVAFRSSRFIELTGTPAPNGLQDTWGQSWFLDKGKALGLSYESFKNRWFQRSFSGYGVDPLPFAQDQIQTAVKHLYLTIDAKDYFDLQDPIVRPVYVDLPPEVREKYAEMEREMFTEIEGNEVEAFGAAGKTLKCLQLASGAAYVGESNTDWVVLHDEKIEALRSIVEEANGAPVLVAYHFKSDLARLLKAFPKGRHLDKSPKTIKDWNAGHIPVLFAHPASAGHGLNLQYGGNILVYFSHWWDLEQRQQVLERIGPVRQLQAGLKRPVFVYNIIARRTVDDVVISRMDSKASVQQALLDAMKERTNG